jgi:hypothetical protein
VGACFVKNCDFFVNDEKRMEFGGLFLDDDESVVVVDKTESVINGFLFLKEKLFEVLSC